MRDVFANRVANNVLSRVAKDLARGKAVVCLSRADLEREIRYSTKTRGIGAPYMKAPVCANPACGQFLSFGDGNCHAASPSVHKIRPSKGYVQGNITIICFACNEAIGESESMEAVNRKRAALDFQAKLLGEN